jgi:uncharacterized sporulation protein YeaH/YhbH (DUF444 family)
MNNTFVSELIDYIFSLKKIKECLEIRLFWIYDGFYLKSEYEKNEIEIISHETSVKLIELNKKLVKKQSDLEELLHLSFNKE